MCIRDRHNEIDIINLSFGIRKGGLSLTTFSPYREFGNSCGGYGDDEMAEYKALKDYGAGGGLAVLAAGNEDVESGGGGDDGIVFIPGDYSTTLHMDGEDEPCWEGLDNVISVGGG